MKVVFDIAMESLAAGAPGLAEPTRQAIARNIAMKVKAVLPAAEDDQKCPQCRGTGRFQGAYGGPGWPACPHCSGTGRTPT